MITTKENLCKERQYIFREEQKRKKNEAGTSEV